MLAVSPLRSQSDESQEDMESLSIGAEDFAELSEGNLLESINFDDLFAGINDGDVLPDLEMDPEMFAEFSLSGGEESEFTSSVSVVNSKPDDGGNNSKPDEGKSASSDSGTNSGSSRGEEIVSKRDECVVVNPSPKEGEKGRKSSSAQSKNPQVKKKVKKVSC